MNESAESLAERGGASQRRVLWLCAGAALALALLPLLRELGDFLPAAARDALSPIEWRRVEPGFSIARYSPGGSQLLTSELFLLKFSPIAFSFETVTAAELGEERSDLRTLTKHAGGIAGINAHFFDPQGKALGLLISEGKTLGTMHRGGGLLTGVFQMRGDKPEVVGREHFEPREVDLAIQAGPRLLADGKPVRLTKPDVSTGRSGIAITEQGEIILFATLLRFPGASFKQLQEMLSHPGLKVTDALNFDGGSSAQLFIEKNLALADDTFVTGGEEVPVGLIVKRKQ